MLNHAPPDFIARQVQLQRRGQENAPKDSSAQKEQLRQNPLEEVIILSTKERLKLLLVFPDFMLQQLKVLNVTLALLERHAKRKD
mmetsp:Transcript_5056/g.7134  ORF Transcript_5056/g.7134 Transcript_5056/m.7134 type:complete len:85 (-) Transcript_5056:638-892(-)